jgi:hypothetical protein
MASSKNKLTEEQLKESLFQKIMQRILQGKLDNVEKALKNNPRLKKATRKVNRAVKDYEKEFKRIHPDIKKITVK